MHPEIVLRSLHIPVWGIFVNLACLAVILGARLEARWREVEPETLRALWPPAILGAFLGAHLYYLAAASDKGFSGSSLSEIANIFQGTAVQGGILGGALAAAALLRSRGRRVLPVLDVCSPPTALAQGISRLGCFAAGCCYGRPTASFLGVVFPGTAGGLARHPAQLYEAFLDFLLAIFLHHRLTRPNGAPGRVFWQYVGGYGLVRFFVQSLRDDDLGRLRLGLAHSQFAAAAMILLSAAALARAGGAACQGAGSRL